MNAPLDVSGQRYGLLVAIRRMGRSGAGSAAKTLWEFKCDCGSVVIKKLAQVRRGDTSSCGCQRPNGYPAKNRLCYGAASLNGLINRYRYSAHRRGLDCTLSRDEFIELVTGNCHYCGAKPSQIFLTHKSAYGEFVYSGIDRINNNLGYVPGNVITCCKVCNRAKNNMLVEEWQQWLDRVVAYRSGIYVSR